MAVKSGKAPSTVYLDDQPLSFISTQTDKQYMNTMH